MSDQPSTEADDKAILNALFGAGSLAEDITYEEPEVEVDEEEALADSPDSSVEDVVEEENSEDLSLNELADEVEAEEVVEEEPKISRSEKRIRDLANERSALRDEMGAMQAQFAQERQQLMQQFTAQSQQQQAYMQQLQAQNQALMQQFNAQKQAAEDANLSPLEKLQRDVVAQTQSQFQQELEQRFNQLNSEREQERAQAQQRANELAKRARFQKYANDTKQAVSDVLGDLSVSEDQREQYEELYLLKATSMGMAPGDPELNRQFSALLDGVHKTKLAAHKKRGAKVRKSQAMPKAAKAVANGAPAKRQQPKEPSLSDLREAGYVDYLDYYSRNL